MFNKYTDLNRNNGGNQSEKSFYFINDTIFEMHGYHNYKYDKKLNIPIIINNNKQIEQLNKIKNINFKAASSLLDLGCGNGVIGLSMLFMYNFNKVTLLDHDKEYIQNLNKLIEWEPKLQPNVLTINLDFGSYQEPADYVLVLSLIHWLYSATSDFGCLFKLINHIKQLVKIGLIIEWIDNDDTAIKFLNHINFNSNIHITPYNKDNFLKALNINFSKVTYLDKTTETRELYYCEI